MSSGSGENVCGCDVPWPQYWMVGFNGCSDGTCVEPCEPYTSCCQYDRTNIIVAIQDPTACALWDQGFIVAICGASSIIDIEPAIVDVAHQYWQLTLNIMLTSVPSGVAATYKSAANLLGFSARDIGNSIELPRVAVYSDACIWPTAVTLKPVGLVMDNITPDQFACFLAMLEGCAPGTSDACLNAPPTGGAMLCCLPDPCNCEDPTCGCNCRPQQPNLFLLVDNCVCTLVSNCPGGFPVGSPAGGCGCSGGCDPAQPPGGTTLVKRKGPPGGGPPGGGGPSGGCGCKSGSPTGSPPLNGLNGQLGGIQGTLLASPSGSPRLNLSNGNLMAQVAPPMGRAADPIIAFTYNSLDPVASPFGTGWRSTVSRKIELLTSDFALLTTGTGSAYRYRFPDTSGRWFPPPGVPNALTRNTDGSWTETQPDGFQMLYDSTGSLTTFRGAAGTLWTLTRDSGSRVIAVTPPLGNRTSLVYDSTGVIRRFVDSSGRITSFTVNGAGDLAAVTTPELCQTGFRYDVNHRMLAYIRPGGGRTSYSFDHNGWANSVTTPGGGRTTYAWEDWYSTVVTEPGGGLTTLSYNFNRNVTGVQDALGGRSSYVWEANQIKNIVDGRGNRTTLLYSFLPNRTRQISGIIEPTGGRTTYLFDSSGRAQTIVNQRGFRTTLVWDSSGNRTAVVDATGARTTFAYTFGFDAASRQVSVQNGLGFISTTVFDAASRVKATVDPLGNRVTTIFDAASRHVASIDPLNRRSTTVYDNASRVRAHVDVFSNRTTLGYDAAGQNVFVVDALSRRKTTVFDPAGRVKATVDALSYRTTLGYDAASRQISIQNALGFIVTSVFDPANRLRASVDQLGNRVTFTEDAASRRVSVQNPLGKLVTTLYDAANWVRATVNPLGFRTSIAHNPVGWQTAVVDANSNRTTTVFDATGRPVATVNALGNRVTEVFDAAGRRTALVDARSNRYTFVWDAANRQVVQVDPLSRRSTFAFNAASEQTLRIDARGYRTTYVSDSLSRPVGRQYPDGSRVTMAYDAVSNRTLLADSTGRYTTLYDALSRARAVTNPANLTISYSFDAASRRRTMVEPFGGVFTYGYSPTNLNTLVVNPQGERTTWQFDAASRVTVQRLANLIRVSYAYDDADRLVRLANLTSTGATITSYSDAWDAAGNRLARLEQDGTLVTWSYDRTYQLTRERRNGDHPYDTTYAYDPAGNRSLKLDNSVRTTYSYDAANQIQKSVDNTGTTTFVFDTAGNQCLQQTPSSGTTTNTWDFENRLTQVALPSGILNSFAYSGDGLRVQRQDSTGTSKHIWDGQKIVEETDGSNVVQVVYTQSDGEYGDVVSQRRSGVSGYFQFDPLGSTGRITDSAQGVTDTYLFKAFGESMLTAGTTINPFQFVGRLGYSFDKNIGQHDLRARSLVSSIARFLARDRTDAGTCMTPYTYADNNPLSHVDPSGFVSIDVRSKSSTLCGGASIELRYKPRVFVGDLGSALLVDKICITFAISFCPGPAAATGCCCAPVAGTYDNPCCFYESYYIGSYKSWQSGKVAVTDRLSINPASAPDGCPNTLGYRSFDHQIRVFTLQPSGVPDKIRKEWNDNFNAYAVRCHGVLFKVARATQPGAPMPSFWNDAGSLIETGRFQWQVSWNCCCPQEPWQRLR